MTPISSNGIVLWQLGNSLLPSEGPASISTSLNFALDTQFDLNALNLVSPGQTFSMVQCIFIDTSNTDQQVTVTAQKSGQVIKAQGRTQGYYPVVAPNLWDLVVGCSDALAIVPVVLLNYCVPPGQWAV